MLHVKVMAVVSCPAQMSVLQSSRNWLWDLGWLSSSRAAINIPNKSVDSRGWSMRSAIIPSITVSRAPIAWA